MKILITGATGLIGRPLCRRLTEEGHAVIALSRDPDKVGDLAAAKVFRWQAQAGPPPAEAFDSVEAVVHLAGEPIAARRWSEEQKQRIRDSRVISTRHLVNGMRAAAPRPAALISSSAVGFYGDRGDELVDEDSPPGAGFMPDICREWETEAERASEARIRVVVVRTGVVLAQKGGALEKMLPPFKLGVGGRIGDGRQWFPWIHLSDIVEIFRHAIFSSALGGVINGVAPAVVTNSEFARALARALGRPAIFPVPQFALRLMFGEMADVLLGSQRVAPKRLLASGYEFRYAELQPALADLVGGR
ncbi:MAG TPA: TIGR01777 family oxidoreductase [Blastocatellia bacterium]|nr:TIGR01777 family oxidoreductase [Blastocatellia bacterium]